MAKTALQALTFTTLPTVNVNPVMDRRTRTIEKLEEQKLLLKDPKYTRTIRVREEKDGVKATVEKAQRVLPWWRTAPNGFAFFIKAGLKALEFQKGETAVAVASLDQLPKVIDTLIAAVRNGELDAQLTQAAKASARKKK
jgi:hypothetical protein